MRPFRVPLESDLAPEEAVSWLRGEERPFALVGEWLGGVTVFGSHPARVADPGEDAFAVIECQPELERLPPPLPGATDGAVVGGGWVGWLGYGLGSLIEQLPPSPPAPVPCPPFSLTFYDHVVLHDGSRWWFEGLWSPERAGLLEGRMAVWKERMRQPRAPAVSDHAPAPFVLAANGGPGHLEAVADCRRRIEIGELYQANLCVRLESRYDGDPLDLFARALPLAQPRFGALVGGVVSLSPERFLRREGREVWTEPIKGTRPRTGSDEDRQAAREALVASTKDAAEHVMIVDLMRNDLGRVCAYGTVQALAPRDRAPRRRVAPGLDRDRPAARRRARRRVAARHVPARLGDRGAEGPGDEGDRDARGDPARGLHRARSGSPARSPGSTRASSSARSRPPATRSGWASAARSSPTPIPGRSSRRR